jgi:N-acetylmuramoyl-L-alanine amidase
MILTALQLATTAISVARGISSFVNKVNSAVGFAKSQFDRLRNSSLDAIRGKNKEGIDVEFVADERYNSQGDLVRRFSIGTVGSNVTNFGSFVKSPLNSDANTFYKTPRSSANLNRIVTAVTTDGAKAAVTRAVNQDPDKNFTNKVFRDNITDFSEKVFDGTSDRSTLKGLLNDATSSIDEAEKRLEANIASKKVNTGTILGDLTDTEKLEDNIVLDSKSDLFGLSTVETIDMKNVPSKTILKTYEEMEAYIRSCTREITEVVVHHTDTYENQPVDYDDIYKWHVTDRGFKDVGYHLLILRNGDLQVARPISVQGAHVLKGHNPFSIGIAFVGGLVGSSARRGTQRSSTTFRPEQWNTFKAFMRAFYTVHPGGQAFGHNDIDPDRRSDPNFDVVRYVRKSFGKENIQTVEETRSSGALSIDEILERQ